MSYFTQEFNGTQVNVPNNTHKTINKYFCSKKTKSLKIYGVAENYNFIEFDEAKNILIYKENGSASFAGRGDTKYHHPSFYVAKIEKIEENDNEFIYTGYNIYEIKYGKGFLKEAKKLLKEFISNEVQIQVIGEFDLKFDGRYISNSTEKDKEVEIFKVKCIRYIQTEKVLFETELNKEIYDLVSENWFDFDEKTRKCLIVNEITDIFEQTIKAESLKQLEQNLQLIYKRALTIKNILQEDETLNEDNLFIAFNFSATDNDETSNFEHLVNLGNRQILQFTFFKTYKITTKNWFETRDRYYHFDLTKKDLENNRRVRHEVIGNENLNNKYKIIKWTKEREDFFKKIEKDLKNFNSKISEFSNNFSEENIDLLITSNQNLLNG